MVVYSDTLHNMWGRMYAGGVRNPGVQVSLPLHNVWERMYAGRGKSCLGCPYLCIMCGRGCTLEGGNPAWGVPTSA